jgi:hypothetical protein
MMHLLPENDELVWEVTSAGAQLPDGFDLETWLDRLSRAIASGEIDIPELGLAVPRYPNSGHEPPIYENVTDLVLGHLLPYGHKPLLDLLDALEQAYRQQAAAIFLALLVIYSDKINDLEGARAAFEGLETPTSASYAYIKAALQQLARERGGRVKKRKQGICQYVEESIAENSSITAAELWKQVPSAEDHQDPLEIDDYQLYRAMAEQKEVLAQLGPNGERTISQATFRRYVRKAKSFSSSVH